MLNKAYFTLLRPLTRGLYLLDLLGMPLKENEIQPEPEFLAEIMEINEALAEVSSLEDVEQIGEPNLKMIDKLERGIFDAFKRKEVEKAKKLLSRLKYYANIQHKVRDLQLRYHVDLSVEN